MLSLWQVLHDHADKIPFALAAAGNHQPKFSTVRIAEAVVIAGVIGAMGYFLMVPRVIDGVTVEIQHLQKAVDENRRAIEANRNRYEAVRRDVDRQSGKLLSPRPHGRDNNREPMD